MRIKIDDHGFSAAGVGSLLQLLNNEAAVGFCMYSVESAYRDNSITEFR